MASECQLPGAPKKFSRDERDLTNLALGRSALQPSPRAPAGVARVPGVLSSRVVVEVVVILVAVVAAHVEVHVEPEALKLGRCVGRAELLLEATLGHKVAQVVLERGRPVRVVVVPAVGVVLARVELVVVLQRGS